MFGPGPLWSLWLSMMADLMVAAGYGDLGRVLVQLALGVPQHELTSALVLAATHGQTDLIRILIDAGAELNPAKGLPPLTAAVRNGHVGSTSVLLEAGAVASADVMLGACAIAAHTGTNAGHACSAAAITCHP